MVGSVFLMFCEYASIQRDFTATIVRGGLETWSTKLPVDWTTYVFVTMSSPDFVVGDHQATIELINPSGLILLRHEALFHIRLPEFPFRFVVPMAANLQTYGTYIGRVTTGDLIGEATFELKTEEP